MLRSVGYTREDVIIGSADEVSHHQPSLLLILGETTAQRFLNTSEPLDTLRGRLHEMHPPMIITYSPTELTLNPENKKKAYHDLQLAQKTFANFA
jgi:uracil-DNA glycosylase family 4